MESDHFIIFARDTFIRVRYVLKELELLIKFVLLFILSGLWLVAIGVSMAWITLYMSRTVSKMAVILEAMISYFFFKMICSRYLIAFENLSTHLFNSWSCFVCINLRDELEPLLVLFDVAVVGGLLFNLSLVLVSSEAELEAEHEDELEMDEDCELTDIVEKVDGFM